MIYQKQVEFGGESFTIEANSLPELFQLTSHYREMQWRLRHGKNMRWNRRTVTSKGKTRSHYEVWGTVDGRPARMQISQYENPPEGVDVDFFIGGYSRWEFYNKEKEQVFVFEIDEDTKKKAWVPAKRVNGRWKHLKRGWWTKSKSESKTSAKKKRKRRHNT